MAVTIAENTLVEEITCSSLLQNLQEIWDEIGESDEERDRILLQIEQECLDIYRKKVEQAAKSRTLLLQALTDSQLELSRLLSALGQRSAFEVPETSFGTIKEELAAIAPALELLYKQKEERVKEFSDVQSQIQKIYGEISVDSKLSQTSAVDKADLSLKKWDEYRAKLQKLQREKTDRLHKVLEFVSTIHDLCAVLGLDCYNTLTEIHPSLNDSTDFQSKSISDDTLSRLAKTVLSLKEDKRQRLHQLQEFGTQLIDLWNLMDTSEVERKSFSHVTCNISVSVDDVTVPGALAFDLIEQAEVEVERLDQLKASRMKEIALKKQAEIEEIFGGSHIEIDSKAARKKITALIDSGEFEPVKFLADMDRQIENAKEEVLSRREILDKVDKWMSACEEESWLEDYNRDQNRYNASRGAHLNLKRAEKARILVNKLPSLVDALVGKTRAWEEERGVSYMYDGVSLLAMLDEYAMLRHEREEEKRKTRDQKKFHEQQNTEQGAIFGSRLSPTRPSGTKKVVSSRVNGNTNGVLARRLSLNAHQNGSRSVLKDGKRLVAPVNYVAVSKEDPISLGSGDDLSLLSP